MNLLRAHGYAQQGVQSGALDKLRRASEKTTGQIHEEILRAMDAQNLATAIEEILNKTTP